MRGFEGAMVPALGELMRIDDHVVPIEIANRILAVFGITKPSRLYERRLRPAGFRLPDFVDVLYESRFVFAMDWRGVLEDFIEDVLPAVADLGVWLEFHPQDDGTSGTIAVRNGRSSYVHYVPVEGNDFNDVVRTLQRLCGNGVEFRCGDNAGTDTWVYAVLKRHQWEELDATDCGVTRYLFRSL